MAVIGNSYVNIIDELKGQALGPVVNMLRLYNTIYEDAITVPANKGASHMTTIMTGLPSVTWGKLYQGIPQSKTTRQQVEDTTGFVEGLSTIDSRLLDLSDDPGMTRLIEAQGFMEAFAQEIATGIFYFDTTNTPEKFKGLCARYNTVAAGGGASNNVVDAGGSGSDNTSIWLVSWGDNFTHLIHPKNTIVGLERQDKGEQRLLDASSNPYYGQEELFRQHIGLTVRDWRYNCRIANIDVSDLIAGSVDLYLLMRKMYWRVKRITRTDPNPGLGVVGARQVIYCNAGVLEQLDSQSNHLTNNAALRIVRSELEGAEVMTYRGIPIRQADAILNTEARVV